MKKLGSARQSLPHGKGSFAVRGSTAHGIVAAHGRDLHLCRANVLCRALASAFAVCGIFAVRSGVSLPCVALCRVFYVVFVVCPVVAVRGTSVARQRYVCRVMAHGIIWWHGSSPVSGSVGVRGSVI
jgi:hypothetical protein